jgi:hypothetical protein
LLLYLVAALRGVRRTTMRFQAENARIGQWLETVIRLAASHAAG